MAHATGKIKWLSFVTGTIYLLSLPINYIFFRLFPNNPLWAYYISVIMMIFVVISNIAIFKKELPQYHIMRYLHGAFSGIIIGLFSSIPAYFISIYFQDSFLKFILVTFSYILVCSIITFYFALNANQRTRVLNSLRSKIHF